LQVGEYSIFRCSACDFEFVSPVPGADAIAEVYAEGYFRGAGHGYADYFEAERASNRRKAEQRLDRLTELGLEPGAKLLDLGCADGTFVQAALARGFDAFGIEVSSEAVAALPAEIRSRVSSSLDATSPAQSFDAITLWDVLEHLPEPLETLRTALSRAVPGAHVGVVVPVIDNFNARFWPASWDQYKPPEHLWYFSRRSLRALLEREVGEVALEEQVWRREARLFEVAARARGRNFGPLPWIEKALTRALMRARIVPAAWVEDSVAMYARKRPPRS
jgi:hypothetical protein